MQTRYLIYAVVTILCFGSGIVVYLYMDTLDQWVRIAIAVGTMLCTYLLIVIAIMFIFGDVPLPGSSVINSDDLRDR